MSAIEDSSDGPTPLIKVLFALYPGFDTLDFTGPLEVLSWAQHNVKNASSKAFKCQFVAAAEHTVSAQGASFRAHMDYEDAHGDLEDYDVLLVPGGSVTKAIEPILATAKELPTTNATATTEEVRDGSAPDEYKAMEDAEEAEEEDPHLAKLAEPLKLIKKFAALQKSDPAKERTLIAIGTGSLLLAGLGLLQGLGATTHPDHYTKLELTCQEAARRGDYEQTDVMEERYVVNNARFALGEEDNPWIFRKKPAAGTKSIGRKGSNAWKEGNKRRESVARRATLRLGGLRVITSGGTAAGLDVALYLTAAMVSHESAEEVARVLQYKWEKGVTVDGIDV